MVNPLPAVKLAMNEVLKEAGISRETLIDDMNGLAHLAGIKSRVSKAQMDKWLNKGADGYIPHLGAVYLFCQALGNYRPLAVFVQAFPELHLVEEEDYQLLEWARAERAARQAKRQARELAPKAGLGI